MYTNHSGHQTRAFQAPHMHLTWHQNEYVTVNRGRDAANWAWPMVLAYATETGSHKRERK